MCRISSEPRSRICSEPRSQILLGDPSQILLDARPSSTYASHRAWSSRSRGGSRSRSAPAGPQSCSCRGRGRSDCEQPARSRAAVCARGHLRAACTRGAEAGRAHVVPSARPGRPAPTRAEQAAGCAFGRPPPGRALASSELLRAARGVEPSGSRQVQSTPSSWPPHDRFLRAAGLHTTGSSVPRASTTGSGARDRTSSVGAAKRVFDLRHVTAVEVPRFELDEDPAFWKDHNVQVWVFAARTCEVGEFVR